MEYSSCKTVFTGYQEETIPMDTINTMGTVLQSRKNKSYHQLGMLHQYEERQNSRKSINLLSQTVPAKHVFGLSAAAT